MGSVTLLNKKFFTASFIFFLYILTCQSATVGPRNVTEIKVGSNETLDPKNLVNYREGRRSVASGGLFSIVSFDNVPCQASSGDIGVCYTQRECDTLSGTASGICAGNFGVCCVIIASGDSNTISINNTYWTSPGYPTPATGPLTSCLSVTKLTGAVELYLEFIDFQIRGPSSGICTNDTFTVSIPGVTTAYPVICGNNVGQTEYLDISSTPGPVKLCFNIGPSLSRADVTILWKIRLVQFKATDACAAPAGCSQYFQDVTGTIQSYNFNNGEGEFISNGCTNYCFGLQSGYCSVMLTENTFMLPGVAPSDCSGDFLLANGQQFCGDTLSNGMILVNQTVAGDYVSISVCGSGDNPDMDVGFNLTYTQIPCSGSG